MAREPKEPDIDGLLTSLESMSFDQLIRIEAKTQALIEDKKTEARESFLAEVRDKAQALGLSVVDSAQLMPRYVPIKRGHTPPSQSTGPKVFLYGDSKGNKWTGRGPRPTWLKEALEAGKTLEEMKLQPSSSQPMQGSFPETTQP